MLMGFDNTGAHVISFFEQLAEGETSGGVTTIGDRAVAGARKMLGLQNAGTAGLVQMVNELIEGQLSNQTTTALVQTVSQPFLLGAPDSGLSYTLSLTIVALE